MKNPGQVSAKIALQDGTHVSSTNPLPITGDASAAVESSLSSINAYMATLAGAVTANGVMKVTPRDEDNTNGVDFDNETKVGGGVAHDAADSGNPLKIGGKAIAALSGATLVTAADRANAYVDLDGALLVRHHAAVGDWVSGNASNTDGTSTSVLAAGAAGIKHAITTVIIHNAHATTNGYVELKDNTTVKATIPAPANGGTAVHFDPPLLGSAATQWNFDPSAAITTIYCTVIGFKTKL